MGDLVQGFAVLLATMWPELIAAMPFGLGKVMRFMAKLPGALRFMKPLFGCAGCVGGAMGQGTQPWSARSAGADATRPRRCS